MMKPQHGAAGGGHGRRTPFLTSYALTLAFITFVSVLYFKDFSSTLHQPFLHHPSPRHRRPHHRPRPHPHTGGLGGKVGPVVVEKKAAAASERSSTIQPQGRSSPLLSSTPPMAAPSSWASPFHESTA